VTFAASALDAVTTAIILTLHGVELNPVAGPLFTHSRWWIPLYIFIFPLLLPLLPDVPRRAFATYFALAGGFWV
jgi:hypothetical protein